MERKGRCRHIHRRCVFGWLVLLGVFPFWVVRDGLARTPGGGDAATDCFVEFEGLDATTVTCTDCDPACDTDGVASKNGACTFEVGLCLNQEGTATCQAALLRKVKVKPRGLLPVPSDLGGSACQTPQRIVVSLKKRGRKAGRKKIRVTAIADGRPRRLDKDTILLTCNPQPGECPSPPIGCEDCPSPPSPPPPSLPPMGCGNGMLDAGEECDPQAIPSGCPAESPVCGSRCICGAAGATCDFAQLAVTIEPTPPGATRQCGGAGFSPAAEPPFSGELLNASGAKIADLGLGCVGFGGSKNLTIPPAYWPDRNTLVFDTSCSAGEQITLAASSASGPTDCTKGGGPGRHCLNGAEGTGGGACSVDGDCVAGAPPPGVCGLDANCFLTPPFPIDIGPLSVCNVNVFEGDARDGIVNIATGEFSVTIPVVSRVYLTANPASPCPRCESGSCSGGPNAGRPCTPQSSQLTTSECPPDPAKFFGTVPFTLDGPGRFGTGTSTRSASNGILCPGQTAANAGAFGLDAVRTVTERGMPAGNLSDLAPHPARVATVFCIGTTGPVLDPVAGLPGPGAVAQPVTLQLR